MTTVAQIYNYPAMSEGMMVEGIFSCKQASHCWPGDGNSSIAPLPVYKRGLSLNTSDRMHSSMHQSQEEYTMWVGVRQLLETLYFIIWITLAGFLLTLSLKLLTLILLP